MTRRARLALAVMAVVALVLVAYAPALDGVFVWDDHALIETNAAVQRGPSLDLFRRPFWPESSRNDARPSYYRPLTMLTYRAEHLVVGNEAQAFHLSNLLLHLACALALLFLARRLGASDAAAALATAVWALDPRLTEAVAWVSGRADLLAALLSFLALGAFPWRQRDGERGWRGPLGAGLAGAALLLGLLAKEVAFAAVAGVAAGIALQARQATRPWVFAARRLAWLTPPLAVYLALRTVALRHAAPQQLTPLGLDGRALTVLEAVGRYGAMTLDPWHPATSIGLVGQPDRASVALGVALLLALGAALVIGARGRRAASGPEPAPAAPEMSAARGATVALGLTSLALVVHLVPLALASGVAADRLLYLPLGALALVVSVASSRLPRAGRGAAAAVAVALAVSFVPITRARAGDYTDELRFRLVAAEHAHPDNTSARSGLALVLGEQTETDLACTLHASVRRTLEQTAQIASPRYLRALENLAGCEAALGRYEAASATYDRLERLAPDHRRVHMERGLLRLHTFDTVGAELELRRALSIDPSLGPARDALAALPSIRRELARLSTETARSADPVGWARLLTELGRLPEASAAWRTIVLAPTTDAALLAEGFQQLLANADIPVLVRAVEASVLRGDPGAEYARQRLAKRVARKARLEAVRPRIEALAEAR